MTDQPFWRAKTLDQLSRDEWESLCDGCGKCCLHKLEDMDTGRVHYTNVACRLLDLGTCRCGNYPKRQALVPDCISLDPTLVDALKWMPSTCGYRLVAERKDLPWWHPLVSGDSET
ncbi:MAG: YcgN family cysteine cluster protein, partial [Ferrovibrionaceae bacterium]